MSDQGFTNELERALARPDIDELRRILAIHRRNSLNDANDWPDECSSVIMSGHDDPDLALSLVILASASFDEPEYLGLMAAGPLEDVLRHPGAHFLERIADEARRTPRFRWMLSGVWLHAIHPEHVEAVQDAIGDMSMDRGDPLPPRPWA